MTDLLYRWPATAKFGRTIPKAKFYEHAVVESSVRTKFVSDVHRVTWAYKLAEATVNVPGDANCTEIQIFRIAAKGGDVPESVLAAIDRAVPTPIIFEIVRGGDEELVRMAAAIKSSTARSQKVGVYYTTGWLRDDGHRRPLPAAVTLAGLYSALLEPLLPLSLRPGERMSEVAARIDLVRRLEREIGSLERRLRGEPQLNRKMELRRSLKAKRSELMELT